MPRGDARSGALKSGAELKAEKHTNIRQKNIPALVEGAFTADPSFSFVRAFHEKNRILMGCLYDQTPGQKQVFVSLEVDDSIETILKRAKKILDEAGGCDTLVFYYDSLAPARAKAESNFTEVIIIRVNPDKRWEIKCYLGNTVSDIPPYLKENKRVEKDPEGNIIQTIYSTSLETTYWIDVNPVKQTLADILNQTDIFPPEFIKTYLKTLMGNRAIQAMLFLRQEEYYITDPCIEAQQALTKTVPSVDEAFRLSPLKAFHALLAIFTIAKFNIITISRNESDGINKITFENPQTKRKFTLCNPDETLPDEAFSADDTDQKINTRFFERDFWPNIKEIAANQGIILRTEEPLGCFAHLFNPPEPTATLHVYNTKRRFNASSHQDPDAAAFILYANTEITGAPTQEQSLHTQTTATKQPPEKLISHNNPYIQISAPKQASSSSRLVKMIASDEPETEPTAPLTAEELKALIAGLLIHSQYRHDSSENFLLTLGKFEAYSARLISANSAEKFLTDKNVDKPPKRGMVIGVISHAPTGPCIIVLNRRTESSEAYYLLNGDYKTEKDITNPAALPTLVRQPMTPINLVETLLTACIPKAAREKTAFNPNGLLYLSDTLINAGKQALGRTDEPLMIPEAFNLATMPTQPTQLPLLHGQYRELRLNCFKAGMLVCQSDGETVAFKHPISGEITVIVAPTDLSSTKEEERTAQLERLNAKLRAHFGSTDLSTTRFLCIASLVAKYGNTFLYTAPGALDLYVQILSDRSAETLLTAAQTFMGLSRPTDKTDHWCLQDSVAPGYEKKSEKYPTLTLKSKPEKPKSHSGSTSTPWKFWKKLKPKGSVTNTSAQSSSPTATK